MRIGKISELYHISVDNLYYYIKYGLLVPPRPKGQYVFDQATLKDLEWILELKELDFFSPGNPHHSVLKTGLRSGRPSGCGGTEGYLYRKT